MPISTFFKYLLCDLLCCFILFHQYYKVMFRGTRGGNAYTLYYIYSSFKETGSAAVNIFRFFFIFCLNRS